MEVVESVEADISELNALLMDVQRTRKRIKKEEAASSSSRGLLSPAPKRVASSAWARSRSTRDTLSAKEKEGGPAGCEAQAAALAVRVRAPGVKLGGSGRDSGRQRGEGGEGAARIYDVKDDTRSNRRAPPSFSFGKGRSSRSKTGKENAMSATPTRSGGGGGGGSGVTATSSEASMRPRTRGTRQAPPSPSSSYRAAKNTRGKAFSFGKAQRDEELSTRTKTTPSGQSSASKDTSPASVLDLGEASNALRRHTPGVIMKPASTRSRVLDTTAATDVSALSASRESTRVGSSSTAVNVNVDCQSHRPHVQSFSFGSAPSKDGRSSGGGSSASYSHGSSSKHQSIIDDLLSGVLSEDTVESKSNNGSGGKLSATPTFGDDITGGAIYRPPSQRKTPRGVVLPSAAAMATLAPGPGHYDTSRADEVTRPHVPSATIVAPNKGEASMHMQRKQYWEEKARDAREEHDNLAPTSFSAIEKHVPSAKIYAPSADEMLHVDVDVDFESNNRRARVQEVRRQRRAAAATQGTTPLDVAGALEALEGTAAAPLLEVQARAEQSTQKMLMGKPQVIAALQARKTADMARDRFLGPQLPVAWAAPAPRAKSAPTDPDSPTREVRQLLALREKLLGGADADGPDATSEEERLTEAYLAGQYSGNIKHVQGPVLRPAGETKSRKVVYEPQLDYLSTQVPIDWGEEKANDRHRKALRFDLDRGRDEHRRDGSGKLVVKKFTDPEPKVSDLVYDMDARGGFGAAVRGMGFDGMVAREEAVGPHGERPAAAATAAAAAERELRALADFPADVGGAGEGITLALDPQAARAALEKHVPEPKIHSGKDRFPEPKEPDLKKVGEAAGRLGGDWFKGMAEEVEAAKDAGGALDFDKMAGRVAGPKDDAGGDAEEEHVMIEELGAMGEYGGDHPLELEVRDWKPHKPKVELVPAWRSAEERPRFERETDAADEPAPEYDVTSGAEALRARPQYLVDMQKQLGRGADAQKEEDMANAFVDYPDGDPGIDSRKVQEVFDAHVASEKDRDRTAAEASLSGAKRMPNPVDMAKQRSRADVERKTVPQGAVDTDYDVHGAQDAIAKRLPTGVAFHKRQGREEKLDGSKGVDSEPSLSDVLGTEYTRVRLDLEPNQEVSSKWERPREVGDWSKDKAPAHTAGEPVKTAGLGLDGKYVYDPDVLQVGPKVAPAMKTEQDRFEPRPKGPLVRGMAEDLDVEGDNVVLGVAADGHQSGGGRLPPKRNAKKKKESQIRVKRTEAPYEVRVLKTSTKFVSKMLKQVVEAPPRQAAAPPSNPPPDTATASLALDLDLALIESGRDADAVTSPPPSIHAPTPKGARPLPAPTTKDIAALEESFKALEA